MLDFIDFRQNCEISKEVNISGIINSRRIEKKFQTGSVLERFGVILPCNTNIILEVWNTSKDDKTRPKFAKDWKCLQLITVFGGCYGGEVEIEGKLYKVFRIAAKNAKFNRFIWLSPEKHFWVNPIRQRDSDDDYFELCDETWPDPAPVAEGILKKSSGSYISNSHARALGHLRTKHFSFNSSSFTFESLVSLHQRVRKGVSGFVNLATGKQTFERFNFDR